MNRDTAETFIAALAGKVDAQVTFQTFDDGQAKQARLANIFHGPLHAVAHRLDALNGAGAGIFLAVNVTDGKGRKAGNVTALRALFMDADKPGALLPDDPRLQLLPPDIIVESSPGKYHYYWLLKPDEDRDLFTRAQVALAKALGTDPAVKDLARVLRIPGFLHRKGTPQPVKLLKASRPAQLKSIHEVLAGLGVELEPEAEPLAGPPAPSSGVLRAPRDVEHEAERRVRYIETMEEKSVEGENGSAALMRAMFHLKGLSRTEEEALTAARAWNVKNATPPWSDGELLHAIRNSDGVYGSKLDAPRPEQQQPENQREGPRRTWAEWVRANGAEVFWEGATPAVRLRGQEVRPDRLLNTAFLDMHGQAHARKDVLGACLEEWFAEAAVAERQRIIDSIAYDPALEAKGWAEMERWVRAATGQTRPVDVAVMLHFIWQVQRKSHGLKVEHHAMPVLVGPQGSGKTEALRRLLAPLWPLVGTPASLKTASDDRGATLMEDALVLFVDEMGLADRTDLDLLKNRVSEERITYRVLGKNMQATARNNATWVGASNRSTGDLFPDHSGLRRFPQLTVEKLCDWDAVNRVDSLAIWKSVDPRAPSPLTAELRGLMYSEQQAEQARDPFEVFCEEREAVGGEHRADTLYQDFVRWAAEGCWYANRMPISLGKWRKKLARRWAGWRRTLHGYPVYLLPAPGQQPLEPEAIDPRVQAAADLLGAEVEGGGR